MEPHDLVLSKLGAGREKDLDFARAVAKLGLVEREILFERLASVETIAEHRKLMHQRIGRMYTAR